MDASGPWRFRGLPTATVYGRCLPVALGLRARLIGLALLDPPVPVEGLVIPRCASIHTFGMRFELTLIFLDRHGRPLSVVERATPGRVLGCRRAASVVELVRDASGAGGEIPARRDY